MPTAELEAKPDREGPLLVSASLNPRAGTVLEAIKRETSAMASAVVGAIMPVNTNAYFSMRNRSELSSYLKIKSNRIRNKQHKKIKVVFLQHIIQVIIITIIIIIILIIKIILLIKIIKIMKTMI